MKTSFTFLASLFRKKEPGILIAIIVLVFNTAIQAQEKKITSEIKEATIYLNRAQLNSVASTHLEAGNNTIVIEALPASIDPNTIQVRGKGDFVIVGVKYENNYLNRHIKSPEILKLEDSLKFYQFQLNTFRDFEDVMVKEEQMLIANQAIGGKDEALDADDLEYFANFFRKRILDIRFQILKNKQDMQGLSERVANIQKQINVIGNRQFETGRVVVNVSAKSKTPANLEISYVVANAGWQPTYDIRVKDTQSPASLSYKANIYQQTGVEWKNVKLRLSTNNPTLAGGKPELMPNYLNIQEADQARMKKSKIVQNSLYGVAHSEGNMQYDSVDDVNPLRRADGLSQFTDAGETPLAVEFVVNLPYTIPSSPELQIIDIQSVELPAQYQHYTVPKLSNAAFLVALVTGYDDKNLISGTANIFFEGTFVGKSYIDMNNTEDTLQLSLGRDNNVVVERKPIKEFRSKAFLGTNKKEEFAYEISVRNTKDKPIEITIEDQYPVSQNNQIEVVLTDAQRCKKDDPTGKLIWKLNLPPSKTETVSFKYSVKYPKTRQISGLK